ncbi:MAG: hypothetical protein LBU89_02050 [Fibromonadaceae bacterium]|jgi:hypothetical protein|nr:hypothetical protein [Fibromonadaceae bacterium]
MKITRFVLLVAAFAMASMFFACSTDDIEEHLPDSSTSSSSEGKQKPSSSSSQKQPSSSSSEIANPLEKKTFTLSFAGSSYGDLDGAKIYRQGELTATVKERIDVVAYYENGLPDEIINPCLAPAIGFDACGWSEFFPIPDKYQDAVVNGESFDDIQDFIDAIKDGEIEGHCSYYGCDKEVLVIDVVKGKAFMVFTGEFNYFVVVMTDVGTRSVDLEFYDIFGNLW